MLKACQGCKKFFEDYTGNYSKCPSCRETEEELLRDIKDYLWNNPGTTEAKLEEMFNVSRKQIAKWLREGRLEVAPNSGIKLRCERCGSMISSGRYCKDCEIRLTDGFKKIINDREMTAVFIEDTEEHKQGQGMRFFKR